MKITLCCMIAIILLFSLAYNGYAQEINKVGEEELRERIQLLQSRQPSDPQADVPPIAVSVIRIANVIGNIICFSFTPEGRREFCLDDGTEGIYGTLRQVIDTFSIVIRRGNEILNAEIITSHGYPRNVLKVYNDSDGALQIEGPVRNVFTGSGKPKLAPGPTPQMSR